MKRLGQERGHHLHHLCEAQQPKKWNHPPSQPRFPHLPGVLVFPQWCGIHQWDLKPQHSNVLCVTAEKCISCGEIFKKYN